MRTYYSKTKKKWTRGTGGSEYKLRTFKGIVPKGYDHEKAFYSEKYRAVVFPKKSDGDKKKEDGGKK